MFREYTCFALQVSSSVQMEVDEHVVIADKGNQLTKQIGDVSASQICENDDVNEQTSDEHSPAISETLETCEPETTGVLEHKESASENTDCDDIDYDKMSTDALFATLVDQAPVEHIDPLVKEHENQDGKTLQSLNSSFEKDTPTHYDDGCDQATTGHSNDDEQPEKNSEPGPSSSVDVINLSDDDEEVEKLSGQSTRTEQLGPGLVFTICDDSDDNLDDCDTSILPDNSTGTNQRNFNHAAALQMTKRDLLMYYSKTFPRDGTCRNSSCAALIHKLNTELGRSKTIIERQARSSGQFMSEISQLKNELEEFKTLYRSLEAQIRSLTRRDPVVCRSATPIINSRESIRRACHINSASPLVTSTTPVLTRKASSDVEFVRSAKRFKEGNLGDSIQPTSANEVSSLVFPIQELLGLPVQPSSRLVIRLPQLYYLDATPRFYQSMNKRQRMPNCVDGHTLPASVSSSSVSNLQMSINEDLSCFLDSKKLACVLYYTTPPSVEQSDCAICLVYSLRTEQVSNQSVVWHRGGVLRPTKAGKVNICFDFSNNENWQNECLYAFTSIYTPIGNQHFGPLQFDVLAAINTYNKKNGLID